MSCHRQPLAFAFIGGSVLGSIVAWWSFRYTDAPSVENKTKGKDDKTTPQKSDAQKAEEHLWQIVKHSFTGSLIRAGDKLGIYEILWHRGASSPGSLSEEKGWSERWLREFLSQSAAAGICSYNGASDTFELNTAYAALLRGPEKSQKSMAGMFQFLLPLLSRSDSVAKAIQTGLGVDYDWGDDVVEAIDRKNRNWFTFHLIDDVINKVKIPSTGEPLAKVLERGVNAADVGCGCGASTMVLAERFPKSHFFAYEASPKSMHIMEERLKKRGISNVTICDVAQRTIGDGPGLPATKAHKQEPGGKFTFVYAHDVLHDMTDPKSLIGDVKRQLSKDGCWVIVDVICSEQLSENIAGPSSELLYGFSCLLCLSSATSTATGEGLGTCGFPASLCRQWTKDFGFSHFEEQKLQSLPNNSCFVVG